MTAGLVTSQKRAAVLPSLSMALSPAAAAGFEYWSASGLGVLSRLTLPPSRDADHFLHLT